MAFDAPTIIDLKSSFLRAQILALSQPLRPSTDFTTSNSSNKENALRQKNIDDALYKLNGMLKKHNKLAYGPQAQRHVAEQVDRLYWNAGERGVHTTGPDEEWAERGTDYRKFKWHVEGREGQSTDDWVGQANIIEKLPEEWSPEAATKAPEQAAKFTALQQHLAELNERRQAARERVEAYKAFKETVDLFGEDAGVQGNLVTKNGEVEEELEKMRRLMLRVERGIRGLEEMGGGDEGMDVDIDVEVDEQGKLLALLSGN